MTPKRAMEVFLETPGEVHVHALTAHGVRSAIKLKVLDEPVVHFKFSPRYESELLLEDDGVRQALSFEGTWASVFVPWAAIFAMHKDPGVMMVQWSVAPAPEAPAKPKLSLVKGGPDAPT